MALKVGIVGCGNISDIYAANARLFRDIEVAACADMRSEAAERVAAKYGLRRMGVEELLTAPDIDVVLNLTIPAAHAGISRAAIRAGKHVYSEKPLATTLADGMALVAEAERAGLRVGCAPDTILGAGIQTARDRLEAGEAGTVVGGLAAIMSRGMEHWHPNPAFFYQAGAGPVLDLGPYYIHALTALLGPVRAVTATGLVSPMERRFGAEGPDKGKTFPVGTFTSVHAVLRFASGADVSFIASWDVLRHGVRPIELYGTAASLRVPDPDTFGGEVELSSDRGPGDPNGGWAVVATETRPFGKPNYPFAAPTFANYRGIGLAEMANAIAAGRPHRCSGRFALHALSVMLGMLESAAEGRIVEIAVPGVVPARLTAGEAAALLKEGAPAVAVAGT